MNNRFLACFALSLASVAPVTASLDVAISAEIRLGKALPPPPPEVEIVAVSGPVGPPPWAPAPDVRRNYEYYYYPGADVYFRPADRMWVYLDGRNWQVGLSLPSSIRVDFDRSVSLTMATDRPYEFHDKVKLTYPADYFVTKVRVKEKGKGPEKTKYKDSGPDDSRDQEHGKGKGKGKEKNK